MDQRGEQRGEERRRGGARGVGPTTRPVRWETLGCASSVPDVCIPCGSTLFDVPVALVCARLVDNEDASRESRDAKGHQAAYAFLPHLFEALEHT